MEKLKVKLINLKRCKCNAIYVVIKNNEVAWFKSPVLLTFLYYFNIIKSIFAAIKEIVQDCLSDWIAWF